MTVPLPTAVEPLGELVADEEIPATARGADAEDPAASPPSAELEAEDARRRAREADETATELAGRVRELEEELAAARREAERLSATLDRREEIRRAAEQTRRMAEQRAHAEQALRRDLARQLAERTAEGERARTALGDLATAEERIRELELELEQARRRGDEAEQAAAAAAAARERAENRAQQLAVELRHRSPPSGPGIGEDHRLRFEQALLGRRVTHHRRVPSEPPLVPVWEALSGREDAVGREATAAEEVVPASGAAANGSAPTSEPSPRPAEALVEALRRELRARAEADAALRARLVDAEGRLASRVLIDRRTTACSWSFVTSSTRLRAAFAREREARTDAERRAAELATDLSGQRHTSRQAFEAIADLRQALESLRAVAVAAAAAAAWATPRSRRYARGRSDHGGGAPAAAAALQPDPPPPRGSA